MIFWVRNIHIAIPAANPLCNHLVGIESCVMPNLPGRFGRIGAGMRLILLNVHLKTGVAEPIQPVK